MSKTQQSWKKPTQLPTPGAPLLGELKPRAHGDKPALAVVEYRFHQGSDDGFWSTPRSEDVIEILRWRYLEEVEPATAASTERARAIEHALRQIIDADDNQTLTQQLIEIGRRALELEKSTSTEPDDPHPNKTDAELGFNYRMLLRSHAKGVSVNFVTGTMALNGPAVTKSKDEQALNAKRYKKLRGWMSSNVPEGWNKVENLAAVACYVSWEAFDLELDALPICNVGLCSTGTPMLPKPVTDSANA